MSGRPFRALEIADHLIRKGIEGEKGPFIPLQVIKLVYFCQAWMLGLYGERLIKEDIEAWIYGPVVSEVYRALKHWRNQPITCMLGNQSLDLNETERDLIDQVIEIYGDSTGPELSQRTHAVGTPWHQTWKRNGRNAVIPVSLIQDYYEKLAEG